MGFQMEALFWLSQIERDNGLIWSKKLQLDTAISQFRGWKMCIEGALIRNNVQTQAGGGPIHVKWDSSEAKRAHYVEYKDLRFVQ